MRVHIIDSLIHRRIGHNRQDRSEDFLLHDLHIVGDVAHDGQRHLVAVGPGEILARRIDLDQLRTLVACVDEIGLQPLVIPTVHHRRIIVIVQQLGILRG